jgi:hypothetical protein
LPRIAENGRSQRKPELDGRARQGGNHAASGTDASGRPHPPTVRAGARHLPVGETAVPRKLSAGQFPRRPPDSRRADWFPCSLTPDRHNRGGNCLVRFDKMLLAGGASNLGSGMVGRSSIDRPGRSPRLLDTDETPRSGSTPHLPGMVFPPAAEKPVAKMKCETK